MVVALQLQRDAGLMASNLQVLGQYVMSLINRMLSEVLHLAFGPEVFSSDAVNVVAPGAPLGHPDGSYGFVVTTGWPG